MTISGEILIVMKTNPAIWAVPYLLVTRTTNSPKSSGYTWSYLVLIIHLVVHEMIVSLVSATMANTFLMMVMRNLVDGKTDKAKVINWGEAWLEQKRLPTEEMDFIFIFPLLYFHYHISISIFIFPLSYVHMYICPFSYFPLKIWITFSYFTILWILLSFVDKSLNLLCSLKFLIV